MTDQREEVASHHRNGERRPHRRVLARPGASFGLAYERYRVSVADELVLDCAEPPELPIRDSRDEAVVVLGLGGLGNLGRKRVREAQDGGAPQREQLTQSCERFDNGTLDLT